MLFGRYCQTEELDNFQFVELQKTPAPFGRAGVSVLKEIVLVSIINIIVNGAIVIFQNEQAFKVNHISTFGIGEFLWGVSCGRLLSVEVGASFYVP